jgi:hypothetical protein
MIQVPFVQSKQESVGTKDESYVFEFIALFFEN